MVKREFSSGGIVARKKGKTFLVLLIKDGYGRWTWPKGNIKKTESSEDAAVREIEEEVGAKNIRVLEKIGQTQYFYKLKNVLRFKTVFLYLCETKRAKLKIQKSEIEDAKWFTPEEALKTVEYKGSRQLLKKAIDRFKWFCSLIIISFSITCLNLEGQADTVHLKDETALKGIVVEDYVDRIVYSTVDGEIEIPKSDITRIVYDETIDNLINLGDTAFKKGYYKAAFKYYLMAQEINPNISALNNKIYHTETIIYKTPGIQKREYLDLKNEIISGRTTLSSFPPKGTYREKLQKELGAYISRGERGRFYIDNLTKKSPFKKAGALKEDAIIAIWSNLCDYLTFEDLYAFLTNPDEPMSTVTIERELTLQDEKPFGAKLAIKWEGTVVETVHDGSAAKAAGLKGEDLIIAIGGKSIRYTPLGTVLKSLLKRKPKTTVTIQRKLIVFK